MAMEEELEEEMGVPAGAGDEPYRLIDAPTARRRRGLCTTSLILIDIPTSTGGDGRGGSCVAADIKESSVQGTLCQLLHCVRPPLQIIF